MIGTGMPPGIILQMLFLREQLVRLWRGGARTFLEIGSGNGHNASILLGLGFTGVAYDLGESACENNRARNRIFIEQNRYKVVCGDFFQQDPPPSDIILSCMVVEHFSDEVRSAFFLRGRALLTDGGRLITIVPGSMRHWGVEDEVAGHMRRYEYEDLASLALDQSLRIVRMRGLTYPISNWLFAISNHLVLRYEGDKRMLSQMARTICAGNREVPLKTKFPRAFNLLLNPVVLYPLHMLQKRFGCARNALVLYVEMAKPCDEGPT